MSKLQKDSGFTILELLIATTVFSVILLIVTTGIIKIGNIYYKGITSSKTQDVTRSIANDFSSTIQFANGVKTDDPTPPSGATAFCLGDIRYNYYPNREYVKGGEFNSGLFSEDLSAGSTCSSTNTLCASPADTNCIKDRRQLLGSSMRILTLDLAQLSTSDKIWSVVIRVAYGTDDLLSNAGNSSTDPTYLSGVNCKSGISGSSFCSVAELDTLVKKRVE